MSKLRVLCVDDEPDIREIALLSLGLDSDIEARSADSGPSALDLLSSGEWPADIILLDVMMPSMDGPTTFALIRAMAAHQRTPVIFVTARAQSAEKARLLELGALGVVSKPFDPMTLASQVRSLVRAAAAG